MDAEPRNHEKDNYCGRTVKRGIHQRPEGPQDVHLFVIPENWDAEVREDNPQGQDKSYARYWQYPTHTIGPECGYLTPPRHRYGDSGKTQHQGLYPKNEKCLPKGLATRRAQPDLNSRVQSRAGSILGSRSH